MDNIENAPKKSLLIDKSMLNKQQREAVDLGMSLANSRKVGIVAGAAGTGKCLGKDTPVLLFSGEIRKVQDIKVGDVLMGPDSLPRNVLSINSGRGPLYRISPVKGDPWVCNDVHVLTLAGTNRRNGEVIDVPLNEYLEKCASSPNYHKDWKLFRAGVNFEDLSGLAVDPYMLGLWLGDGTLTKLQISKPDPEILDYLTEAAYKHDYTLSVYENKGKCPTFNMKPLDRKNSPLKTLLSGIASSGYKYIPLNYLTSSRSNRLQLLAGLVDTDGFVSDGGVEIVTKYDKLHDDILFLCRSLGFAAFSKQKIGDIKSIGFSGVYHRIFISGDCSIIPTKIARKKIPKRNQIKRVSVTGFTASPIGEGDYYGFTLDSDGRFLLGDFTVTHNTSTLRVLMDELQGEVTLLAPTNRAAQRASTLSGHAASTFHTWMYKPLTDENGEVSDFIRKPVSEMVRPKSGLIIADEASMIHPEIWDDTLDIANNLDCGILLVGDYFQLPPVMPQGEEFSVFDKEFAAENILRGRLFERVDLLEVQRQAANSPIIQAATELRENPLDWRNAVSILENTPSKGCKSEQGYNFTQPKDIARKIKALIDHDVDHCAIVFTNNLRHDVNRRVREFRGLAEGSDPIPGEPLLVRRNNKSAGVSNGELIVFKGFSDKKMRGMPPSWRVTSINNVECIISVDVLHGSPPPKSEELKGLKMPFVEANFGYAMTCHSAQGSEFNAGIVNWESALVQVMPLNMRIRWLYTAFTRFKEHLMISGLR